MDVKAALEKSKSYLASPAARASIARDPYWPKWDTPWWHMCLLNEMGLAGEIPTPAVDAMVSALRTHYLSEIPLKPEDVPPGIDTRRQVACLCSIGNMYQTLFNAGVDVDRELPWMRTWFLRYQLPDGGLNCDEAAYTKPLPKSSIVTTIACLEAVLYARRRDLTADEKTFLDRGASYLVRQKLFRKVSTGEVIDPNWLEIRFPRFYEYDFLRGYYFLAKWRAHSGFEIPAEIVEEVAGLVARQMTDQGIRLRRYNLFEKRSLNPSPDGSWSGGAASEMELMKAVSFEGALCDPLTRLWNEVR